MCHYALQGGGKRSVVERNGTPNEVRAVSRAREGGVYPRGDSQDIGAVINRWYLSYTPSVGVT